MSIILDNYGSLETHWDSPRSAYFITDPHLLNSKLSIMTSEVWIVPLGHA